MAILGTLRTAANKRQWLDLSIPIQAFTIKEGSPYINLTEYSNSAADVYEDHEAVVDARALLVELPDGMGELSGKKLPLKVKASAYLVRPLTDEEKVNRENSQQKDRKGAAIARDQRIVDKLANDAGVAGTDAKSMLLDKIVERMFG